MLRDKSRRHRFVVRTLLALTVAGVAVTPVAASAAQVEPDPEVAAIGPAAAGDRVQRSSSRSRDVTGDGLPDIVAREPGLNNGSLWVYTNSGNMTFSAKTLVRSGFNTFNWVGVGDFQWDLTNEDENGPDSPADLIVRRETDGALFVLPHRGTFNGTSTFADPVQVGSGWKSMVAISVADVNADGYDDIIGYDAQDSMWVYPHSGTFNGTQTFQGRVKVRQGRLGWLLYPSWSRENPDLVSPFLATGFVFGLKHTAELDGEQTWEQGGPEFLGGDFKYATTTSISLLDFNSDGLDDMVKRTPDGKLIMYPFLGWDKNPALGGPIQIGTGWNSMDLIT